MKVIMKAQIAVKNDKLNYFKQKIIDHLRTLKDTDPPEVKKAMAPGTIREWKGKKYIKGADKKWRRYYNQENRGARMSVKHLIKKVQGIDNVEDLMKLVLLHRDRFVDSNGNPLPFIQELSQHVHERQGKIAPQPAAKGDTGKQEKKETGKTDTPKWKKDSATEEIFKKHGLESAVAVAFYNAGNLKPTKADIKAAILDFHPKMDTQRYSFQGYVEHTKSMIERLAQGKGIGGFDPKKSEAEKKKNRSDAMKGNQNAKKDGAAEEPQTNQEMKAEQTEEKKARKKAKQPTGKRERSSALKDSTWDPKSEDYRYKDTGYIAGSKKEMASSRIKKSAAAGEQVENNSIDWDGVEENERLAETLITKSNLFGKVDWDTLKAGGMTGPAGFIVNKIYGAIGSKPMDNSADGRFNYSRGLDSIRSRMEVCKTLDEVRQTMMEIYDEMNGQFVESKQTPEYIKLAERLDTLKEKLNKFKAKAKEAIYAKGDPFAEAGEFLKRDLGSWADISKLVDQSTGAWRGAYWARGNKKKQYALLETGQREYEARLKEFEDRTGISQGDMAQEIHETDMKMRRVLSAKNEEVALTNTIGKAWGQLGIEKVLGAVKYSNSNKTMEKHLYEAGQMEVNDWAWSGKRSGGAGVEREQKTKFELLVAENIVRKGGRDITVNTTEELKKAFNLRDVQSGNWVLNDPKSAKFHVDNIAMGLADMGDILGIPDNLISLNGRLAMAIGARGSGKALAHYEPVERVINITKMKGGGSLGHEWFHALDNLIAAAMTGGENWSVWLTEAGGEGYQLTDKQKKIKRELEYRKKAMENNPESEYQKRYYEEAKQKAIKAKVPVFEGGPDEHIQRVKAAFDNLAHAMMNGTADAEQTISFTKKDFDDAKRYSFYGVQEKTSPDEVVQYARQRGWKISGSRDKAVRCAIARWIMNQEGGADKYLNGKGEGSVKVKTGDKTSAFYKGAKEIDGDKGGDYWSSLKEMGARAFSAFLNDKMKEKGWENNYLTHATSNQDYGREEGVYPEGEERKAINDAFEELFKAINETGAIRKAITMENTKIVIKKALYTKAYLKNLAKSADKDKLTYFKKLILKQLGDGDGDPEEIKKAGYAVGTIREWKGKKYIKTPSGKWKPKYDSDTRGAKLAVSAIKKKVNAANSPKDLMDIVMEHRDRFSDAQGQPLPMVQELSKYVAERQEYLPENIKAKRKQARSDAKKSGQKKARDQKEAGKKAAEENIRQKAERMKKEQDGVGKEAGGDKKEYGSDDSQESIDLQGLRDKYQSGKTVEGNDDEIYVGDEAMKGKWKLVEADSPSASHDETTFQKTRGFPKNADGSTINDRDYQTDRAAQETVLSMGGNFDGRALSFDSPMVVTPDGIVVSGNNRTMSSKIAAKKGSDTKYIDALRNRASRFGFKAQDVEGFKHPRVVFEVENKEGGYSTQEFAKYNQESQKTMSPIEAAVKVSKVIKEKTVKDIAGHISEFETMGELYADKKGCMAIFNSLEQGDIINQFGRNSYIDPDGVITGAGKEFLETVLIGSVVSEKNIRGLNREGCKHIRAKLVRAITPLVNNKSMGGYSIMEELNQAIDLSMQFNTAKDKFGTLDDLVKQGSMFEDISGVSVKLAEKLQMNQKEFADFMQKMSASLEVGASGQSDIFVGDVETKDDILNRMLNIKKSIQNVLKFFREGGSRDISKADPGKPAGPKMFDVALDFDGVINSYKNGWKGDTETDDPVPGVADGILELLEGGRSLVIYSTRAGSPEGKRTIYDYLWSIIGGATERITISAEKPIATVYIDDRAITFDGNWKEIPGKIDKFKSWIDKSLTWSGYKLQGRTKVQGMDISIENKKGSVRSGTDKDGHDWSIKMNYDYGYIRGTVGRDKDHLDCYIGPDPESETVFIIRQNHPDTGKYDEDKVMLGFNSIEEARKAYLSQYDRPGFLGDIDTMGIETFKDKIFDEKNRGKKVS
ncbi:hypothetical protein FACS189447_03260 [Spirochaetia bacterium]|nr:hypothetical protein FACS189447_03260 [Spirochaetia bacterium]